MSVPVLTHPARFTAGLLIGTAGVALAGLGMQLGYIVALLGGMVVSVSWGRP